MNLPIKIMILLKNNEPLYLLRKNLLIEFNDETAMIINIYSKKDYEEISKILNENGNEIQSDLILNIYLKEEK